MGIRCEGTARLKILETDEFFDVNPGDLEWELVDSEQKSMGTELYYSATFYFHSEREGFEVKVEWDAWEYPTGTIECVNVDCEGCELLENFYIDSDSLEYDPYDDQLDAILSNTEFYRTFFDEISSLRMLNSLTIEDFNAQKTLRRQIFVSAVTCLETYLSDAFINTVLSNKDYLKSFFCSFDFKNKKIGMNELFSYVDKAEEIAKKEMLEVIYHNLPKVSNMYKSTFDICFPDFSEIQKYIVTRHDLVHRNGKTKEGWKIALDQAAVVDVICRIENFVNALDQELKGKEKSD